MTAEARFKVGWAAHDLFACHPREEADASGWRRPRILRTTNGRPRDFRCVGTFNRREVTVHAERVAVVRLSVYRCWHLRLVIVSVVRDESAPLVVRHATVERTIPHITVAGLLQSLIHKRTGVKL